MSINKATGKRGIWRYNKETDSFEQVQQAAKVAAPSVITDDIPPTMSMTGSDKWFTSKSALRRHYKDEGYVETGTVNAERPKTFDREQRRRELREAIQKAENDLKYGMAPLTEKEREQGIREERRWKSSN